MDKYKVMLRDQLSSPPLPQNTSMCHRCKEKAMTSKSFKRNMYAFLNTNRDKSKEVIRSPFVKFFLLVGPNSETLIAAHTHFR